MSFIKDCSIDLIVTSPPYWQLKDYGVINQIGFGQSYEDYVNSLNIVWKECYRVLKNGSRLCINIGDQFARAVYYGRYKVVSIHSEIIRFCEAIGFDYMGSIIWQKPTSMHPTGGSNVMGSYPYPKAGIIKIDFEYILLLKKRGNPEKVSPEIKNKSKLSDKEWRIYFNSHWIFSGEKQNKHIAVFPVELPHRLIKMFSFYGDTIFDPFMGSGTTALAALKNHRNVIGYELNPEFIKYYKEKVNITEEETTFLFHQYVQNEYSDIEKLKLELPYKFKDNCNIQLDKEVMLKNTYGSVISKGSKNADAKDSINNPISSEKSNIIIPTVLINHVNAKTYNNIIKTGIVYVRIGNIKGSITVTQGFSQLSYVLIHTLGQNPLLFKLEKKGSFQIWTRETLINFGFNPKTSPYYAIMKINKDPIKCKKIPSLSMGKNTFIAKILPITDFEF